MPKIEVMINRLRWILARGIEAIKACLLQNLSQVARLVLEIWDHKISLSKREWVIEFGYLPLQNGFYFWRKWFSCPAIILFHPKLSPRGNFSSFQADDNFFIFKIFETSRWEKRSSNPSDWPISLELVRACRKKVREKVEILIVDNFMSRHLMVTKLCKVIELENIYSKNWSQNFCDGHRSHGNCLINWLKSV